MRRVTIAAMLLAALPVAAAGDQASYAADPVAVPGVEAPAPWNRQDPADSLYRAAREAMNRGEYERAARGFNRIWEEHPGSAYAPDALYWEAFNRYRIGETDELERAMELLELQRQRYAEAQTRTNGDARSLSARITGLLARRGDEYAAQSVALAVNEIAGMSQEIGAEVAAQMAVVAEEMAAQGELIGREAALAAERASVEVRHALAGVRGGRMGDIPEQCRDEVEMQLAALNALIHMKADRAIPALERVMARRDECATPIRRRAVFLIADKQSDRTVDLLLQAAREDPDLEVRRQAVFWLSEVDDPRAVDALDRFLAESQDEEIRDRAVFALSQHDSPRAREILRRVAGDEATSPGIRSRAIFWLGSEGGPEDIAFLKEMFGRTSDPEAKERILFAVGQADRPGDAEWLLSVASDSGLGLELREKAMFWAAEAGASPAELGRLYGGLQDRELKERILFGLSQSSRPEAIDKLIEIARTEQDPELRKRAIFWLGNSNDPRAADVLIELLTGGG
ncbi:MAG: HEAT repeat domain-containing protein [Gemmatimonadota bacterium]